MFALVAFAFTLVLMLVFRFALTFAFRVHALPVIRTTETTKTRTRTGLTSVVVGGLFLLAIFFSPIAGVIPAEATAPVLVIVGYLMMQTVGEISWRDPAIGIPALLTIVMMPFTYSITNGVGAGFLAYVVIKVLQGKFREVHPLMYVVAAVFSWYFFHGLLA